MSLGVSILTYRRLKNDGFRINQDEDTETLRGFFVFAPTSKDQLQLNVIDRETLLRARENPDLPEFRTLIVRVWGFSAVFVELPPALQDHVLARTEHSVV